MDLERRAENERCDQPSSDDAVKVDRTVCNAARIVMYGRRFADRLGLLAGDAA
jgi:hypothetical protein